MARTPLNGNLPAAEPLEGSDMALLRQRLTLISKGADGTVHSEAHELAKKIIKANSLETGAAGVNGRCTPEALEQRIQALDAVFMLFVTHPDSDDAARPDWYGEILLESRRVQKKLEDQLYKLAPEKKRRCSGF
jgi:hypothetical protein